MSQQTEQHLCRHPRRSPLETRPAPLRLLRTGEVPVRVENHRDRPLAIKRGELPRPEVNAWRPQLRRDFELARAETKRPY
ncbi:MAG TPA: hypothetical protein VFC07_10705 [Verrucomicrobiae bacterium]|nr:hypothetical protein [Verrucomicrobiae bacterium]